MVFFFFFKISNVLNPSKSKTHHKSTSLYHFIVDDIYLVSERPGVSIVMNTYEGRRLVRLLSTYLESLILSVLLSQTNN